MYYLVAMKTLLPWKQRNAFVKWHQNNDIFTNLNDYDNILFEKAAAV